MYFFIQYSIFIAQKTPAFMRSTCRLDKVQSAQKSAKRWDGNETKTEKALFGAFSFFTNYQLF